MTQLQERGGALEIALPVGAQSPGAGNLIWRVRLVAVEEEAVLVEQPSAAGQTIPLDEGMDLIAVMAIGQNRWMFHTRTLGTVTRAGENGRASTVLRLASPALVERCQRRNFYRISTAELSLPRVECWALIDPTTVAVAEIANRSQILEMLNSDVTGRVPGAAEEPSVLPEVGPKFPAQLVNVGGGGVGLMIDRADAAAMERSRLYWLRINLMPHIPAPIAMTARLAHTHIDSTQNLYAGLAFDFAFNQSHRQFVVDQICRYVGALQRQQVLAAAAAAAAAAAGAERKSA